MKKLVTIIIGGTGQFGITTAKQLIRKKYKVIITRETIVEAKDEEEAKDMAFDSMVHGDVDFEVEEDE